MKRTGIYATTEELVFEENSFYIVISSLVFHYVDDYKNLQMADTKRKADFSVEHPVFTAYGTQDWYRGANGEILHFPVDNYYYEGKRITAFLGEMVEKYHRTITTYCNTLLKEGFTIKHIVEPQPPEDMMDIPGMKDEMRRPMMLLISAVKN